ncbi:MAG: hypothetical protein ACLSH8_03205 [Zhenhengia sp.]|uniref:hypothetical protein n=1 Tax=Zhenhengia sp. TaxID=2944208 RepID=UPI00290F3999|nr:hypothetical protein [Clostridiales bacterium]
MNEYEILLEEGHIEGIEVLEMPLESDADALCVGNTVALNKRLLRTTVKKRCRLSEELWHSKVTVGDITDTSNINNMKQERFARRCSFKDLVPPDKIVQALLNYCLNLRDICDYLTVTEEYFCDAITYYKQKYGLYYGCKEYTLCFEPLSVMGSCITEYTI